MIVVASFTLSTHTHVLVVKFSVMVLSFYQLSFLVEYLYWRCLVCTLYGNINYSVNKLFYFLVNSWPWITFYLRVITTRIEGTVKTYHKLPQSKCIIKVNLFQQCVCTHFTAWGLLFLVLVKVLFCFHSFFLFTLAGSLLLGLSWKWIWRALLGRLSVRTWVWRDTGIKNSVTGFGDRSTNSNGCSFVV